MCLHLNVCLRGHNVCACVHVYVRACVHVYVRMMMFCVHVICAHVCEHACVCSDHQERGHIRWCR